MDEWDAMGPGMKIDRRATDWGLASLGVCGVLLLMAPIQLFFNDFYWAFGINRADRQEIQIARVVCPLVGLMFEGLVVFGIVCGFRGVGIARSTQQSVALPLAGILVGFVDVILWLGLTLNLMAILGTFL